MYDHQKEYPAAVGASFASTGIKHTFSPGLTPAVLRRVGVVVSTQMTVTPPVLTIKHRPTAGSASGETTIDTITVPTALVAGKVVYVEDLNQKVMPGEQVVFDVTTAATAGVGDIVPEFDRQWDIPQNDADMSLSA